MQSHGILSDSLKSEIMKIGSFIFLILLLSACSNSRLLSYDSIYLGEDEKYFAQVSEEIIPRYENGKIIIDQVIDVNACGDYGGAINVVGDSIFLIQDNSSFTLCASKAFLKVKYVIQNPENKKYKFDFKFE